MLLVLGRLEYLVYMVSLLLWLSVPVCLYLFQIQADELVRCSPFVSVLCCLIGGCLFDLIVLGCFAVIVVGLVWESWWAVIQAGSVFVVVACVPCSCALWR